MSNDTRGPRKGRVPPHIQERVQRKREKRAERLALGPWYRRPWFLITVAALVALIAGVVLGRLTAPDPVEEAAESAEQAIGILDQSEVIWRGGTAQGAPPVTSAVDALRAGGDTSEVEASLDLWLTSYDQLIGQLETVGVPPAADGVRRLALASARLSRDATEVLGAAAAADGQARELLLDEVERLRVRAEENDASARRLLAELQDEEVDVPAPDPTMPTLPRPAAPAPENPADEAPAEDSPTGARTEQDVEPTPDVTEPEPSPGAS